MQKQVDYYRQERVFDIYLSLSNDPPKAKKSRINYFKKNTFFATWTF